MTVLNLNSSGGVVVLASMINSIVAKLADTSQVVKQFFLHDTQVSSRPSETVAEHVLLCCLAHWKADFAKVLLKHGYTGVKKIGDFASLCAHRAHNILTSPTRCSTRTLQCVFV